MKGGHSIKILGNNGNYDNKMPSMNCFANKIKGNGVEEFQCDHIRAFS